MDCVHSVNGRTSVVYNAELKKRGGVYASFLLLIWNLGPMYIGPRWNLTFPTITVIYLSQVGHSTMNVTKRLSDYLQVLMKAMANTAYGLK